MAIRWGNGVQLAAELGITKQAVRKAEVAGRIARSANGLFDLDAARIQYRLHTDPEQQLRSLQQRSDRATGVQQVLEKSTSSDGKLSTGTDKSAGASSSSGRLMLPPAMEFTSDASALVAAKARREAAEADLAELELAEKRGTIMAVSDHKRIVFTLARGIRDALLQVAPRCASILAAESDQAACQRIVETEIRTALQHLTSLGGSMEEQDRIVAANFVCATVAVDSVCSTAAAISELQAGPPDAVAG